MTGRSLQLTPITVVPFLEASLAISEIIRSKFPEITNLKPQQRDAILQYILRKDVFAVLPTGLGKSTTKKLPTHKLDPPLAEPWIRPHDSKPGHDLILVLQEPEGCRICQSKGLQKVVGCTWSMEVTT